MPTEKHRWRVLRQLLEQTDNNGTWGNLRLTKRHSTDLCYMMFYYMAKTGRMNRILRCDWLPELARWSYRARSWLLLVSRKKNFTESQIIPLFPKLVRSRWLDIGLETESKSINRQKKELGQYPAILTSHLVNNPISEAYHLEAINSDPMQGFFSEPIKIYFLI